ncbi:MAG: hypothetical protein ACUVSX_15865 [Aggregatilineales bacterium]
MKIKKINNEMTVFSPGLTWVREGESGPFQRLYRAQLFHPSVARAWLLEDVPGFEIDKIPVDPAWMVVSPGQAAAWLRAAGFELPSSLTAVDSETLPDFPDPASRLERPPGWAGGKTQDAPRDHVRQWRQRWDSPETAAGIDLATHRSDVHETLTVSPSGWYLTRWQPGDRGLDIVEERKLSALEAAYWLQEMGYCSAARDVAEHVLVGGSRPQRRGRYGERGRWRVDTLPLRTAIAQYPGPGWALHGDLSRWQDASYAILLRDGDIRAAPAGPVLRAFNKKGASAVNTSLRAALFDECLWQLIADYAREDMGADHPPLITVAFE